METEQQVADRINGLTERQLRTWEARLRRMAARQGLTLCKSRRRDPRALDYAGYMLADADNWVVAGGTPIDYSLSIDRVEKYLLGDGE